MWATKYIEKLKSGEIVKFRPRGNSMTGKIESGQLVTVSPLNIDGTGLPMVLIGDIVLCKVKGTYYLHLIKDIQGNMFLIGNNKGKINGWTTQVYGVVIDVE